MDARDRAEQGRRGEEREGPGDEHRRRDATEPLELLALLARRPSPPDDRGEDGDDVDDEPTHEQEPRPVRVPQDLETHRVRAGEINAADRSIESAGLEEEEQGEESPASEREPRHRPPPAGGQPPGGEQHEHERDGSERSLAEPALQPRGDGRPWNRARSRNQAAYGVLPREERHHHEERGDAEDPADRVAR